MHTTHSTPAGPDAVPALVDELTALLRPQLPVLVDVAADLHAHPEIRFTEVHAAARLTAELTAAGFAVDHGFGGLETAFVGRWSTPDADEATPTIAIFCEYDALEGIGHACGHNIIAAAGLGAGLLLKSALETAPGTPAHVVVIGSPGEEGAAGKVPMIEAGVLDGVDLAIMVHPSAHNSVDGTTLSRVALDVEFRGRASHAAASPELGVNALDAATLSLTAIGLLRQQLTDDVRVHAIVTDGGQAPNIIPEHAALRVFVRAGERDHLLENVVPRVRACFEGAALATGCEVLIEERTPPYFSLVSNPVLAGLARAAYERLGREVESAPITGSTDMGNVSHIVPAIHPMIRLIPDGVPHTREFAAAAGGPQAEPAIADGAVMLAATALAVFREPALAEAAQRAFDER
ncbi:M20 family metallopeptidase [Microbacterium sp. Marseille-Q6965]|uniref:M20 family metallopeptidase n=1 Tax=Microbacterium sp. Marseille-Q6965 TaxID=2965072 RepID=UPI0021B7C4DB|nr:M20 family metallopeptidase [Microbacterium sp. Marseille-Q6965]